MSNETVQHWDGSRHIELTKERSEALVYAEARLRPWANWIRDSRESLGFPTISLLYKAMRQKTVRLRRDPNSNPMSKNADHTKMGGPEFTAIGKETRSFKPNTVAEPTEAVADVDAVVNTLPKELREVVVADFFVYGPIETRARSLGLRKATYSALLRAAKYSVYTGLASKAPVA